MNGIITNIVVGVVSSLISGSAVLYFSNKGGDTEKIKELTTVNDSIREANKTITGHLVIVTAMYQHTDSVLEATLNDTIQIKKDHDRNQAAHAALPIDSATRALIARAKGQPY